MPQAVHSKKYTQASVGMLSVDRVPQNGQVSSDLVTGTLEDALVVMG